MLTKRIVMTRLEQVRNRLTGCCFETQFADDVLRLYQEAPPAEAFAELKTLASEVATDDFLPLCVICAVQKLYWLKSDADAMWTHEWAWYYFPDAIAEALLWERGLPALRTLLCLDPSPIAAPTGSRLFDALWPDDKLDYCLVVHPEQYMRLIDEAHAAGFLPPDEMWKCAERMIKALKHAKGHSTPSWADHYDEKVRILEDKYGALRA